MAGGPAPLPPAQAVQSWTSGAKDLVMTALGHSGTSRVWATTGQGIFTEIYWPAVDQPQVKDLGFLIGGIRAGGRRSSGRVTTRCPRRSPG